MHDDFGNYRTAVTSHTSKVLLHIHLITLNRKVDAELAKGKAGFGPGGETVECTVTYRYSWKRAKRFMKKDIV